MASLSSLVAGASRRPVVAGVGAAAIALSIWAAAVPRPVRAIVLPGRSGPDTIFRPLDQELGGGEAADPPITGSWAGTNGILSTSLAWGTVLVLVLVAVVATVLVVRTLLSAWRQRRRPPEFDANTGPDLDAVAIAVAGDSEGRRGALAGGTPAEGIIRAWSHLETTLTEAGVPLPVSRTSTEVTLDVLRRFSVDPETIGDLAALYREARYSRHELSEEDRQDAEAAYRALDAGLRIASPRATGARRG